jgi:hypothetical protein
LISELRILLAESLDFEFELPQHSLPCISLHLGALSMYWAPKILTLKLWRSTVVRGRLLMHELRRAKRLWVVAVMIL